MRLTVFEKAIVVCLALVLASGAWADSPSSARAFSEPLLQRWLQTTEEFAPMQKALSDMSESDIAQNYTEKAFAALPIAQQDQLMDQILNERDLYDKAYQILNRYDWNSAGDYMRVSARFGKAIGAYMQQQMLKHLPAGQAQMMQEMTGGKLQANSEDVAFVKQHWSSISALMGKHMQEGGLPMEQ